MMEKSIKVLNISTKATEREILDFFNFAGDISSAKFNTEEASSFPSNRVAILTFRDNSAVETSLLLTGTLIEDQAIVVLRLSDFPAEEAMVLKAGNEISAEPSGESQSVVASLIASGYMVSKDAMAKAKALDERHGISQSASTGLMTVKEKTSATAAALDKNFGISEKISGASASVSTHLSTLDNTYQVSSKAKAAAAAAEASLTHAGQQVMNNPYVASGRDWMVGTFGRLKQQTLEKIKKAEGT